MGSRLTKCPHYTEDKKADQIGPDQKKCIHYKKHSKRRFCMYYRPDYGGHCDKPR